MIDRTPEPELMDGLEQARAYAEEDFSEPNELFLERFRLLHPQSPGAARVLDLGCGPADICLRFARVYPLLRMHALDGSEAMLAHARRALEREPELASRVQLLCATLPSGRIGEAAYDIVLSNSLLHHLHDPDVLWDTIKNAARPGATVLVMDLFRPPSEAATAALVAAHAATAPEVLRRDFHNSLLAAFTPEEVEAQLRAAGLLQLRVERVSDRHLAVSGRI